MLWILITVIGIGLVLLVSYAANTSYERYSDFEGYELFKFDEED